MVNANADDRPDEDGAQDSQRRDAQNDPTTSISGPVESPNPSDTQPMQTERHPRLGDFSIQEKIGEGGMGVVYRAYDPDLQRTVAIKRVHPRLAGDADLAQRFVSEARAIAAVTHANIAEIHAIHARSEDTPPFFVMEFVEGETAERRVQRIGALSVSEALDVITQAARGLQAAQRGGIVHGDVKPSNLVITARGLVKLVDFGLSRPLLGDGSAPDGSTLGTPHYVSPEQSQGRATDHRSDIYSLGCTLFYLVTGKPPFDGADATEVLRAHSEAPIPSARKLRGTVSTELDALIADMLAKKPDERVDGYDAILERLDQCRPDGGQAETREVSPPTRQGAIPWLKTTTWILLWSCTLTLAAIVAISKSPTIQRWVGRSVDARSLANAVLEDVLTEDGESEQRLTYTFGEMSRVHPSIRFRPVTSQRNSDQQLVTAPGILQNDKLSWQCYEAPVMFPFFQRIEEIELYGLSFLGTPDFELRLGHDDWHNDPSYVAVSVRVDDTSAPGSDRSHSSATARVVTSVGGEAEEFVPGATDERVFHVAPFRRYVVRLSRRPAVEGDPADRATFLLYIATLLDDAETPLVEAPFSVPREAVGPGYVTLRTSAPVNSDRWGLFLEKALLRGQLDHARVARDVYPNGGSH
ncbi:MAG: serine/threonine-protein kinase [Planctomycetota bacterium]